jgi:hypothetical protein
MRWTAIFCILVLQSTGGVLRVPPASVESSSKLHMQCVYSLSFHSPEQHEQINLCNGLIQVVKFQSLHAITCIIR